MQFVRVDASSESAFQAWFEVLRRSESSREGAVGQGWHPDEWRARAVNLNDAKVWHLFQYGMAGVGPVAVGAVEVTRDDNLEWLRAELHVDPDVRRRGYGTETLTNLEQYARALGRSRLVVNVIESATEVGRAPNRYFAPARGYIIGDEMVRRNIDWPRPLGFLAQLQTVWQPFATGYEIVQWVGATPMKWVADRVHLSAVMPAEAPSADLDVEVEVWDEHRLRSHERTVDEMGRELFVAAAVHKETGHLVGYSELTVSRAFTETAYQWDTLVVRAHRGHRLGGLLKIATMGLLKQSALAVRQISTFNSSLNLPMIKVNEDLGAYVAGAMLLWRKDL